LDTYSGERNRGGCAVVELVWDLGMMDAVDVLIRVRVALGNGRFESDPFENLTLRPAIGR
jgi:hypothetical protein